MHRVEQTIFDLKNGNCFAASVASLLGLQLEEVPNFCGEDYDAPTWFIDFTEWAERRGLGVVAHKWGEGGFMARHSHCIMCGKNHDGHPHAVVGRADFTGTQDLGNGTQSFEWEAALAWDPCSRAREKGLSEIELLVFVFPTQ